ncbi:hypothetical protein RJ030_04145 [Brucella melitensis]|uniref:hypothetical protein n=1 Tax=Brucella TaxID=234 RepID=UPI0009AD14CD|nr:hypothetical protein [Brucella melitensis]MDT8036149.1 hypothetical protein [Brucella melitensis]MDT8163780.1 hypothetical protein [Brucella melitensis]
MLAVNLHPTGRRALQISSAALIAGFLLYRFEDTTQKAVARKHYRYKCGKKHFSVGLLQHLVLPQNYWLRRGFAMAFRLGRWSSGPG